jgi:hypothetical protein
MTATKSQPLVPQLNEGIQQIEWVNANNIREKIEHSFPLISDVLEEGGILIDR